ncbi:hypothetical protein KA012_01085 [Candidatus Woesebacteria bacterium]|nr:hypothetical protein [Candidatus Woesebacteria bacterium]
MQNINRPFIVLTGDDSVRAEGTILVKRLIQDWADYQIVGTKEQMSGASSRASQPGGTFGTEMVDGHEAIWVSGTPADTVYLASQYLKRPIDLVISGLNMGQNVTNEMHRSGTVGAAVTAAQCRHLKSIALSMVVPEDRFFKPHTGTFDESLLEYPGEILGRLIKSAIEYDIPQGTFWNINFPSRPTTEIKIVPTSNGKYWINDLDITDTTYTYLDTNGNDAKPGEDIFELLAGFITITPCKIEYTDKSQMESLKQHISQW